MKSVRKILADPNEQKKKFFFFLVGGCSMQKSLKEPESSTSQLTQGQLNFISVESWIMIG